MSSPVSRLSLSVSLGRLLSNSRRRWCGRVDVARCEAETGAMLPLRYLNGCEQPVVSVARAECSARCPAHRLEHAHSHVRFVNRLVDDE